MGSPGFIPLGQISHESPSGTRDSMSGFSYKALHNIIFHHGYIEFIIILIVWRGQHYNFKGIF